MTHVLRLALRRALLLVPQLVGITFVVFLIAQILPGDPATSSLGIFASNEVKERFRVENHLEDPLWLRYPAFLNRLLHGDLGHSLVSGEPVSKMVVESMPVTIQLALLAMTFAAVFALVAGVWSALRQGSVVDGVVRVLSMGGLAMPSFWLGLMLVEFVALKWDLLPPGGHEPISAGLWPWLESWILPTIALGLGVGASLARVVRSSMLEELQKDYVRTARGAGLAGRTVVANVLRNALLAPLTVLGTRFAAVLAGAVVIELVFNLPGMGLLLIQSVNNGDLEVIQSLVIITTAIYVVVNLATDVAYMLMNPKIREV